MVNVDPRQFHNFNMKKQKSVIECFEKTKMMTNQNLRLKYNIKINKSIVMINETNIARDILKLNINNVIRGLLLMI